MSTVQKTLYLVRHAKSSWKDGSLSDRDRPLNKRGRRSAPDMGSRMANQGHRPDLIVSSPANRAITTARMIALEVDYDLMDIVTDENLYFSGISGMANVLQGIDDRYQKVMMVGHNPTITGLMNTLGDTPVANMPTCAIAVIGLNMDSWADLDQVQGDLLGYDYPKGAGVFIQ